MEILKGKNQEERGFLSIDALFALVILLLILSTIINIYQGRAHMASETRGKLEGKMISEKLAGAINVVYATGEPVTVNLKLSDNILGEKYIPQYNSGSRKVFQQFTKNDLGSRFTTASVIPPNVDIAPDLNTAQKIRIFWENDEIMVRNV